MDYKYKVKGIKVRKLNAVVLGIVLVICVFTHVAAVFFTKLHNKFQDVTSSYFTCVDTVAAFYQSSNYLTEMTGYFINNQDSTFLFSYFREMESLNHVDANVEVLEKSIFDYFVVQNFKTAIYDSHQLSLYEMYAMKLVAETDSYKASGQSVPEELNSIQLTSEDRALSDSKKIEKARELVYGPGYIQLKAMITNHTKMAVQELLNEAGSVQKKNSTAFTKFMVLVKFLLVMVVLLFVLSFCVLSLLLIHPLWKIMGEIEKGNCIKPEGSYEFRYLVEIYNRLLDKTKANEGVLKYEAEHDGLTGLINRGAFARISNTLEASTNNVALILLDVDKFKEVNDIHGHTSGDAVLRRVADILVDSFRTSDYVARVGGDEFAVIMTNFGENIREILETKLTEINQELSRYNGTVPTVSLSVGVATSDFGYSHALYENADKAMYTVKQRGRNGFAFAEPIVHRNDNSQASDVAEPEEDL